MDKMKITVLLNACPVDEWVFRFLGRLTEIPGLETGLQWICPADEPCHDSGVVYRFHFRLDKSLFGKAFRQYTPDDIRAIPGLQFFPPVPSVQAAMHKEYPADLVINLSEQPAVGPHPQFGTWQCLTAGNTGPVKGLARSIYKALTHSIHVLSLELECSTNDGPRRIVCTSVVPAEVNSLIFNINNVGSVFGRMMIRELRHLIQQGDSFALMVQKDHNESIQPVANDLHSNLMAGIHLVNLLMRYGMKRLRSTDRWRWHLLYGSSASPLSIEVSSFTELFPPEDRFWADPFVIREPERTCIFVEEVEFTKNKGIIRLIELDANGRMTASRNILEKPYHLSYPFVFRHDDQLFMVPETSENRTIELYSSRHPEGPWSFEMNLMEQVRAKDTTLFRHNGKWWMFTSMKDPEGGPDFEELFLYWADDFRTTRWNPHPLNPVSSDIRTSRPAGMLFYHDSQLIRPSQDCSVRYGRALNFNRILELSETGFREERISTLEADWKPGLKGLHTFNADGDFYIVDAYFY